MLRNHGRVVALVCTAWGRWLVLAHKEVHQHIADHDAVAIGEAVGIIQVRLVDGDAIAATHIANIETIRSGRNLGVLA